MAFAMMGGIIVGTLLTLLFLPALYVAGSKSRSRSIPRVLRPSKPMRRVSLKLLGRSVANAPSRERS
jgi:hypothetical protein